MTLSLSVFDALKRMPLLGTLSTSLAELEQRKARLIASLSMSLIQWVALGASGWILALGMDIPLSMAQVVLVLLATIFFATSIPSLPGAIGTFEAAMIYAMGLFGVEKNVAFPYTLVMHALLFLPPTFFAVIFLPREGIGSIRELRSKTQNWRQSSAPGQV